LCLFFSMSTTIILCNYNPSMNRINYIIIPHILNSKFIECFTMPLLSTYYTFYTKVFVQLVYTNQQRMYNGNKSGDFFWKRWIVHSMNHLKSGLYRMFVGYQEHLCTPVSKSTFCNECIWCIIYAFLEHILFKPT
jgi:hypothetical protein